MRGLDARDLDGKRTAARTIELCQDNTLPGTQQYGRIADLQTQGLSHQHAAQVGVRIASFAVRVLRIVVAPIAISVNQAVQKCADVVEQSVLPFVDEDGRGGVQGLQMYDAIADAAFADNLVDAVGDVDQLHPLIGNPIDDAVEDLKTGRSVRRLGRNCYSFR